VLCRARGLTAPVAVNVSSRDLSDRDLASTINRLLRDRDLPASALALEMTESALLDHPDAAQSSLRQLSEGGVGIAVDDFGAGYASVAYLRGFSASSIKLDRSLVRTLDSNADDAAIVRFTVEMGHALGLRCIAEGVESERVLGILQQMGCDEAQGYHLQRPVDPMLLEPLLGAQSISA
jgi:EAL domain-containing protein (putative c-di-GMP-specific phosphodiesterase class I)